MRVLITGAANGLGRALTEELLRQGHQVVAADRETPNYLEISWIAHLHVHESLGDHVASCGLQNMAPDAVRI